jgi:hypothetical protein
VESYLNTEILREPVRFHLLERREGWDYILREQRLSVSDLADPRSALRIGKMLPAEMLLMTSLIPRDKGLTVRTWVVATENGRILFSEDIYTEKMDEDLAYKVEGLVMKIEQRFPLAEGRITEVEGDAVTVDVGAEDGVGVGTRFVVIRPPEGAGKMAGGKVCRRADAFVQLEVAQARPRSGVGHVMPSDGRKDVRAGDFVYAR